MWRGALIWAGIALAVTLLSMLAVGLPGAIYTVLADPVVSLVRGVEPGSLYAGDRAWPLAVVMSIIVPGALPFIHLLRYALRPRAGWPEQVAWFVGLLYLWSVVAMVLVTLG